MLTHAQLLELISYDPATGLFTLRKTTRIRSAGTVINKNKIRVQRSGRKVRVTTVHVSGLRATRAGRVAWFYMTGEWPAVEVDHQDNDGWNQKWDNIREASRSQNQANTRRYKSNSSGKKCVFPSGRTARPWRAQIQKDKRRISLGNFETKDDAYAAYMAAAQSLHGDFARPE